MSILDFSWNNLYGSQRRFNASRVHREGSWNFPAHRHLDFVELAFVAQGQIDQTVCGEPLSQRSHLLCLQGNQSTHQLTGHTSLLYNLNFPVAEFHRVLDFLNLPPEQKRHFPAAHEYRAYPVPPDQHERLCHLWDRLSREDSETASDLSFKSALLTIIEEVILPHSKKQPQPTLPLYIENLTHRLHTDFNPEWRVRDLIRISHASKSKLSRDLRTHLDLTPSAFLTQGRIQYAASLLRRPHTEITNAAFDSGFESLSYFYRRFKDLMGVTPKQYREQA